ncbi:hypothetical protein [Magnetofaba australis]|uniref:Uncharacterized protein n=1 Tax=Magnetofaba australis IT-1 TaxID=1434232 RepID=A0A1Y2K739_9PROT|nr:hypothetical protein [Magnetofaba australis]OSM06114.1 hypothetical protein MAIT1_01069 [Magnetofaba australis IT-1]
MFNYIMALAVLTIILWTLAKLRDIRDQKKSGKLPTDESTLLLGLFYTISNACVAYFREHGCYPPVVHGANDGLLERGYLDNDELASMTQSMKLFSIVISDVNGFGVCLENCTASITEEIISRAKTSGSKVVFMDFKSDRFVTLTPPIKNDFINLTIPLPLKPKSMGK